MVDLDENWGFMLCSVMLISIIFCVREKKNKKKKQYYFHAIRKKTKINEN